MATTTLERPESALTSRTRRRSVRVLARALVVLVVVAATLAGGYLALVSFRQDKQLPVGEIRLSVSPGHRGALDVYVPLVDWGARFEAIRLPARLRVDVRTVDRSAIARIADGAPFDVQTARREARDALAGYLRALVAVTFAAALALGLLTAFAVRHHAGPRLRFTVVAATATATALAVALVVLMPPRGAIDEPQYYAYGADIPRALEAVAAVQRSSRNLDQELDAQLVGLARLVTVPGDRSPIEGRPRLTLASDLHNNLIALPVLERVAGAGPVFFAGDLTDRGSPLEAELTRRVARTGKPFVFVSGNHDSDQVTRQIARGGGIVLTKRGRLHADGTLGPIVNRVAGLRVAGYGDPFERRSAEDFRDRYENRPSLAQQTDFTRWLRRLRGRVDVVLVHQPALIEPALAGLELEPPARPLTILTGHTHKPSLRRTGKVTVINGGSIGGGGTGNLADEPTAIGVARLTYETRPRFAPLAADLVKIDPGTGAATARRVRLDG